MERILTHPCGIPAIIDTTPGTGLFCVGIVFTTGSAHEPAHLNGISHLIEHLVFKGSRNFDAKTIARRSESMGGMVNAYTTKEQTVIYIAGVADSAEALLPMLFDVAFDPLFPSGEIEREKDVIANEIVSIEDDPAERLAEKVDALAYAGSGLAMPVAGSLHSVQDINRTDIIDWHTDRFSPNGCFISASGDISAETVITAVERSGFSAAGQGSRTRGVPVSISSFDETITGGVEQAYASLVFPAFAADDDRRHTLTALSMITGSLMSSRLFETVREKLGLCYTIDMDATLMLAAGHAEVYYECAPKSTDAVEGAVATELALLAEKGVSQSERDTAIAQMLYAVRQTYTGAESRMGANARQFTVHGRLLDIAEIESMIRSVTVGKINALAADLYSMGYSRCRLLPSKY